jgi:RNA polymerase sigma-70 factor, ECF subfamily
MACCRLGHRARLQRTDGPTSAAFEQLYAEHEGELYDYLARRLDAPTAESSVAEVLARAWEQFATRDRDLDERTWLLGLVLSHLEQHRVAELAHLSRLSVSHQGHEVARALAELDPLDRDILTLHVWAGVEHESVAAMTGLSPAATRRRIDQAYAFVEHRAGAT